MSILIKTKKLVAPILIYSVLTIIVFQININFLASGENGNATIPDDPDLIWSRNLGTDIISLPLIDDEMVYLVGSTTLGTTHNSEGTLFALAEETGEIKWQFDLGEKGEGTTGEFVSVVKSQEFLFVGTSYNGLYCFDTDIRKMVWNKPLMGVNTPVISENRIYLTQSNTYLYCLDIDTGNEHWKYPVNLTNCVPAVHDNLVFGADQSSVFALETALGTPVWSYEIDEGRQIAAFSSPVLYDQKLIITSADYKLHVFDLPQYKNEVISGGKELWALNGELFYPHFSKPVVSENKIFICYNNNLCAIDISTGTIIWEQELNCRAQSQAGERLLTISGTILYCLNMENGNIIWNFDIEKELDNGFDCKFQEASIVIDQESLYVLDQSGSIYKLSQSGDTESTTDINWALSFCINIFIIIIIVLVIYVIIKLRSGKTS